MTRSIGRIIHRFLYFFVKATVPFHDTRVFKSIFSWYRTTGIIIIQHFIPLFGNFVMVSLTTRCQCTCNHCGVGYQKKYGESELDKTAIFDLIDQIRKSGAYSIYFFGGEPLVVHDLHTYIAYANEKGLRTRLDTNGLLLDEKMVIRLKKAGLDEIGISIDSLNEVIHDKNRGIEGTLHRALSGLSYCNKHDLSCYISTVATKQSLKNGDFHNIIQLAKSSKNRVRVLSPVHCGRWENRQDVILTPEEIQLMRTYLERSTVFWDSEIIDGKTAPFLCSAIARRTVYISPQGNVQPCCYLPVFFGNIRQEPLTTAVKRMRNSDLFLESKKYSDCPTNSLYFQKNYGQTLNHDEKIRSREEPRLENFEPALP